LVALQQAAVNAVRAEFGCGATGIAAVNGPPGTGKTTLLRDVVAACVMDRALAMCAFEDPLDGFFTTGQKVAAGDRAFYHLYRLDDSLKGHEILVASSNNKAVENVSLELPSAKSVGRDLRYFQTVSDRLLARRDDAGNLVYDTASWGLIAAVLGNGRNRNAFQQAVWWDDDRSLRLYLKAAKGDAVFREIKDAQGRVIAREIPHVIQAEQPPTPEQARSQWAKARQQFRVLHGEIEARLRQLEGVRQSCLQLPAARREALAAKAERDTAQRTHSERVEALRTTQVRHSAEQGACAAAAKLERQALAERPGWLQRLFRTRRFKAWLAVYAPIRLGKETANARLARVTADLKRAEADAAGALSTLNKAQARALAATQALATLETGIAKHRLTLAGRLVDDEFFRQAHGDWNQVAPWVPDELHRRREDLFEAGLAVHKAFIDVAAQKVSHNLGALMNAMQAGAFHDEAKKALLGDLWSTLFMIVPAVSTTFASVDRMLGDLAPASLGWLLIDEA
jgi:hypothetical protein